MKIDVGCGGAKREGFIGLDRFDLPGVDHVLDLANDRWPFEDGTVDHVFSSHFFEHITPHDHLFEEIGRVCKDGAKIEIWTPYSFSNAAFLYTHVHFLNEDQWLQICYYFRDVYTQVLRGRWVLKNINFVVLPEIEAELLQLGFSIKFAIKYLKSVVYEFGIEVEFRQDLDTPAVWPTQTYSRARFGERFALDSMDMHIPASLPIPPAQISLSQKVRELEESIEQKNKHIFHLESLIRRIENGRMLRILRRFSR